MGSERIYDEPVESQVFTITGNLFTLKDESARGYSFAGLLSDLDIRKYQLFENFGL